MEKHWPGQQTPHNNNTKLQVALKRLESVRSAEEVKVKEREKDKAVIYIIIVTKLN